MPSTHRRHSPRRCAARAPRPTRLPARLVASVGVVSAVLMAVWSPHAQAGACRDAGLVSLPSNSSSDAGAPRVGLLSLVEAAARRSKAVGAARLLAEAATNDIEEVRAGGRPQAALTASMGPGGAKPANGPATQSLQLRPALTISAPFYDNGRLDHLTRWRTSLAEAAQQGQIGLQEQVALQTVTLSFDRSRYRLHTQVWQQYAQKVCSIVESLEQIVAADKGRGSELVQSRKSLQQVLLSYAQARTQLAVTETRLRRLVGDELPDAAGLSALMLMPPALADMQQQAPRAADIAALDAQAKAADSLAEATVAANKPQAGWLVSLQSALGKDNSAAWNAGVSVNVPLLNPSAAPAAQAARLRAEAARMQREDALDSLRNRLAEVHEQASASMARARDVVDVLRHSERVREDTLMQWQQLGKRSLFDVISAEGDHFTLRLAYVDALHDGQQAVALMWSLAGGVTQPLR